MSKITAWVSVVGGIVGVLYGSYLSYFLITSKSCNDLFCNNGFPTMGVVISGIILSIPFVALGLGSAMLRGKQTRIYEVVLTVLSILFGPILLALFWNYFSHGSLL